MVFKKREGEYVPTSEIPPAFFEIAALYYPPTFKSNQLAIQTIAVKDQDEDGYGYAIALGAISNQGYWYESMLKYNWHFGSSQDAKGRVRHYRLQGFSVQFHVWDPEGEVHFYDQRHVESPQIREGDEVDLGMEIRGEEVVLGVYGPHGRSEIRYPSYGAKSFISSIRYNQDESMVEWHPSGYFTGIALERYHTWYTWGGITDVEHSIKLLEPPSVEPSAVIQIHARNDSTKEVIYNKYVLMETAPEFHRIAGPLRIKGSPSEYYITTLGEEFRQQQ
ncbi:MAG: hypothetical protein M0Z77_00690 [Thermoplasmatales archaeon]|jgi:hypothetical protein|nr:hypothetical protein [Thermoplasmatales archaeon]